MKVGWLKRIFTEIASDSRDHNFSSQFSARPVVKQHDAKTDAICIGRQVVKQESLLGQ